MKRISLPIAVLVVIFCTACGNDQFENIKKHVSSEQIYPGKFDFATARVGFERVEIDLLEAGRIPASEINLGKAKKTIVEYDDKVITIDTLCSWVNIDGLTRAKLYRFKIYTADEYGNKSVPVETSATPYFLSDLEMLSIPEPRVILTSAGAQVGWPESLLSVTMEHCGMTYKYTDQDGIIHEGSGGPNASLLIENVETGQEVTIELVHRVIPKINENPIIDTVQIAQQVIMVVPQLSKRVNIALNKNVTVSDFRNSGEEGNRAVDGIKAGGGRWVSKDNTNDHWIEIDFGAGYPIDGFQIWTGYDNNYTYPIARFEFQAWVGNQWIDIVSQTGNSDPTFFANFSNTTTSKVRLLAHGQMIRLFEIEVYVTITNPTMRVNVALSRPVTFSDSRNSGEGGDKAVDGNRGTNASRWIATNNTFNPHWLEIELAGPTVIDGFQMWTGADPPNYSQPLQNFRFMAWINGAWQTIVSYTSNLDPQLAVKFDPVTTSRVRLEVHGQETRLFELEIYSTVTLFE